ncbi:hypothetical protein [Segatella buccae]|jgi:hypothetical protein|uniref:hypothetical protein n=1 Tax=Segatella buccae TaxID=28126 RepID=UPI0022E8FCDC|nr:hypothetical protein [Segatella buccae]
MKQLNRFQSILFLAGGTMMVIGAGCFAFGFIYPSLLQVVCWVFLLGAILFSLMQNLQAYEGRNLTVRRLKSIQQFAGLFFILAGISMIDTVYQIFRPLFSDLVSYFTYIYNKWVLLLLVAAVLELYTTHRIASELKKEGAD